MLLCSYENLGRVDPAWMQAGGFVTPGPGCRISEGAIAPQIGRKCHAKFRVVSRRIPDAAAAGRRRRRNRNSRHRLWLGRVDARKFGEDVGGQHRQQRRGRGDRADLR